MTYQPHQAEDVALRTAAPADPKASCRRAFDEWLKSDVVQKTVKRIGRHTAWCIYQDAWNGRDVTLGVKGLDDGR